VSYLDGFIARTRTPRVVLLREMERAAREERNEAAYLLASYMAQGDARAPWVAETVAQFVAARQRLALAQDLADLEVFGVFSAGVTIEMVRHPAAAAAVSP
jgi:hypothetical protein